MTFFYKSCSLTLQFREKIWNMGCEKKEILHRKLVSSPRWPQSFRQQQLIPIEAQWIPLLLLSCVHAACGTSLSSLLCNCLGFRAVSHMGKHLPVKEKVVRWEYIWYSTRSLSDAGKSRFQWVITKIPFSCRAHTSQTLLVHQSKKRVYDPCPFQRYCQDRPEMCKSLFFDKKNLK